MDNTQEPRDAAATPAREAAINVDATALKGLSHPLRIKLLDHLILFGAATATTLGEALGESSGSTSYHLRQLARHGFVAEDATRGTGRERWWRAAPQGITLSPATLEHDPGAVAAGAAVARQIAEQRARQLDAFLARGIQEFGMDWADGSMVLSARIDLTLEQMVEVSNAVNEVLGAMVAKDKRAGDSAEPAPGTQHVMIHANVFPLVDWRQS